MQCTLNFSGEDRERLLAFLKGFPESGKGGGFEEYRCRIGGTTATLFKTGKLLLQGLDCDSVKEKVLAAVQSGSEEVLGIDETGRGESFGPFVVAAVLASPGKMRELRDSKKTKDIDAKLAVVEKNALGIGVFVVQSGELGRLHAEGVSLNQAEANAINDLAGFFGRARPGLKILVDGSPIKGVKGNVSFVVKGDDLNPVIGAASVVARAIRLGSKDKGKRQGWGTWGKKKQ